MLKKKLSAGTAVLCLTLFAFITGACLRGGKDASVNAGDGKKITIELLNGKPENLSVMQELVAKFNAENPDLEVVITSVPDAKKVLLARVAADDVPDISGMFPMSMQDQIMQRQGVFLDITSQPVLKLVSDGVVEQCKIDGKNYALPVTTNATAFFYNTEIFAKYNLQVPQTVDDLLKICETLKKNGVQAFALNDKTANSLGQQFERMLACMADQNIKQTCIDVAAGKRSFTQHEGMRKLAEFMLKQREYGPSDSFGMDTTAGRAEFANGKAAIMIDGSWCVPEFLSNNPNFQFSSAAPPMLTVNKLVTSGTPDTAFAISAKTTKVKECIRFLEFFVRQDVAQRYCDVDLNPNIVKSVNYDVTPLRPINDLIQQGAYIQGPSNVWDASLRSEIQIAVQQMLLSRDIPAFLTTMDNLIRTNYNSKS